MQFARRARVAIVMSVAALALAGCSGDSTPDGYEEVRTGWMRLAVPDGWVAGSGVTDRWTESYQDAEGDEATVQLLLAPEWGETFARDATTSVVATAQIGGLPGFKVVDSPETDEEPDYLRRDRIDFTYEGEDGTYEGVLWGLADDDKHVVLAQLTGKDLDPELVATIDESLEVTG
jgi:hypothetical protein